MGHLRCLCRLLSVDSCVWSAGEAWSMCWHTLTGCDFRGTELALALVPAPALVLVLVLALALALVLVLSWI